MNDRAGDPPILHLPLQGVALTLAANQALGTVALLGSDGSTTRLLRQQRFSTSELGFLWPLLRAYPEPAAQLPAGARTQDAEGPWPRLAALGFDVAYRGGYVLVPPGAPPVEADDEMFHFTVGGRPPGRPETVANQRLCTVALLETDALTGPRMLQEFQLTPQQLAVLIALVNCHPAATLQRDLYNDLMQAGILYGERWMEREGKANYALEHRYPHLPHAERERAEAAVAREIQAMGPLLAQLGLAIGSEPSYYLALSCAADTGEGR